MESGAAGVLSALWLGILTSISPCPLAANIVAISFIGKNVGSTRNVILAGLFYTLGRAFTYVLLTMFIVSSLLSIPEVSMFLQEWMNKVTGPLLVLVGLVLLEVINLSMFKGRGISDSLKEKVEKSGIWGAALLGIVFALTFCPVSAALYFGSLIPLCLGAASKVLYPALYGLGTALPVIGFAFLIAFSAQSVGKAFNSLAKIEGWARRITGGVFILAGIYLSLKHIGGLF
ncbi:MAG: aromatic aminobenezylarsenical efflux permease ArsG family transporter [Candidatus Eremiobacteraeota bacterium]|nr:aromatic aminobenezylarsenical efflux permease ArsG family transporter [Candidatus Eremiobacteraeota bacterium]